VGHNVESNALDNLARVLGIAGVTGTTILDSGNLSQVLEVTDIVRRSRTPGITTGWFYGLIRHVHAAAGLLNSTIDPYAPDGASQVAPFPRIVPPGFDVWLLNASVLRNSGAGTLDGAALFLDPSAAQQGWGIDDSGTAIVANDPYPLARWTSLDTSMAGIDPFGIAGDGGASVRINQRIARGTVIRFVSDVAAAAANVQCMMTMGLFVEGLGQDIAE